MITNCRWLRNVIYYQRTRENHREVELGKFIESVKRSVEYWAGNSKAAYTLANIRSQHRVQEPIREHNVRVISTYTRWVRKQLVANHLHRFLNEHKMFTVKLVRCLSAVFQIPKMLRCYKVCLCTKCLQVYTQLKASYTQAHRMVRESLANGSQTKCTYV